MDAIPEQDNFEMVTDFAERFFEWKMKIECIDDVEWNEKTIGTLFAKGCEDLVREIEANINYGYSEEVVYALQQAEDKANTIQLLSPKNPKIRDAQAH